MISLRARIFIIVSLIILIVLSISIFLWIRSRPPVAPNYLENPPTVVGGDVGSIPASVAPTPLTAIPSNVKVIPATAVEVQQNAAQQLAKIFVERLNSYSTESQFQNVRDVQELVTVGYWKELSMKIGVANTSPSTVPFASAITKIYSTKLVAWSNNNAVVEFQAKVGEEKNNIVSTRDQGGKVTLVKSGENWLVDKFEWVK